MEISKDWSDLLIKWERILKILTKILFDRKGGKGQGCVKVFQFNDQFSCLLNYCTPYTISYQSNFKIYKKFYKLKFFG